MAEDLDGSVVAAVIGSAALAVAFLLMSLFFGPLLGALVALVGAVIALKRRSIIATVAFAAAGTLSAAAIIASTWALVIAMVLFAIAVYEVRARSAVVVG